MKRPKPGNGKFDISVELREPAFDRPQFCCAIFTDRGAEIRCGGWPFSDVEYWIPEIDRLWPGWQWVSIYSGTLRDGMFLGRPLCGRVRVKG